jgi:hypothetical protein
MRALMLALAIIAIPAVTAGAQTHEHPPSQGRGGASPYAGFERRAIKSLSEQQVADLKAGRGAGLALAAELNGYPGPLHLLELADALGLSDEQRARTRAQIEAMKAETMAIGERLLMEEVALDRLFAEKRASESQVQALTSRIGALQGQLRAAHLRYHLNTRDGLSVQQISRYGELRGYHAHHSDHRAR